MVSELAMIWRMLIASWWCRRTVPRPSFVRRGTRARVGSERQCLEIDWLWLPGRRRAKSRKHERLRLWPLPLPGLPPIQRRVAVSSKVSSGAFARVENISSDRREASVRFLPTCARRVAQQFRLDGSSGHRFVDLWLGGKLVSVFCVARGSYVGRVVQRSLLDECLGASTFCRRLKYSWVSCLVRGAPRDSIVYLGKFRVP